MFILTEKQREQVQAIGSKYNLKLLLLHGSYARSSATPRSDLDIAAVGNEPAKLDQNLLELIADLAAVFGDSPRRELDVKTLSRADPLFLYQVCKQSQLLYGNSAAYHEFPAYVFKNFFDSSDLRALEKLLVRRFQDYLHEYNDTKNEIVYYVCPNAPQFYCGDEGPIMSRRRSRLISEQRP